MSRDTANPPRLRDRPGAVACLLALSSLGTAYEIVPASVTPVLTTELGVSATAVSWLVSVMLGVAAVSSVPAGVLVDRTSARVAIALAAALFVVAGLASYVIAGSGAYWPLVGTRILASGGFVVIWNVGLDVFGGFRNPATATSVFTASAACGFALGHLTGPQIAAVLGWPAVFVVYPAVALVPAAAFALTTVGHDIPTPDVEVPRISEYGHLLRNRTVVVLCVLGFLSYSLYLFVNTWMPSYLTESFGVGLAESGLMVAAVPLLGGVARMSGGLITDRLLGGRRRPVVFVSFAVSVPLLAVSAVTADVAVLVAMLALLGFVAQLSLGLFYSYVPAVLPPRFRTSGVALLTSVSLGGAFAAPLIAGALIDYTGEFLAAFGFALAVAVLGTVLTPLLAEADD